MATSRSLALTATFLGKGEIMEKNISKEAWEDVAKEFIAARELRAFNEGMLHIMNNKYSLRDYFAASALAGGLEQGVEDDMNVNWWHSADKIAKRAYAIADAMLKVRGSNGQT